MTDVVKNIKAKVADLNKNAAIFRDIPGKKINSIEQLKNDEPRQIYRDLKARNDKFIQEFVDELKNTAQKKGNLDPATIEALWVTKKKGLNYIYSPGTNNIDSVETYIRYSTDYIIKHDDILAEELAAARKAYRYQLVFRISSVFCIGVVLIILGAVSKEYDIPLPMIRFAPIAQ